MERARALVSRGFAKCQLGEARGAIADHSTVIRLKGAPKEIVAVALFRRGVAKRQLGDEQGAISDCTSVIEREGTPKEVVALALLNRGVAKVRLGDARGAIADYAGIIEREETPKEIVAVALLLLLEDASVVGYGSMSNEQAREAALHFLNALALPEMKETWPNVWRGLVAQLNPAVAEAVRFLEPVCSVLEGKDRTLLDALPPEQREFALEVLAKFEPKAEPNL